MSNNIYDILKKMQGLDAPNATLTEGKKAKPDFLDMDKDGDTEEPMKKAAIEKSKGAIAEAVARVEQQLAEKYMGFKKTVAAIKKGGSAEDPEAVAAAIGRKKYGKATFQKAAAAGKKLGEEDTKEGNEFSGELAKAKATGAKEFNVDGKTYPVKESFPTVSDAEKRAREKEGRGSKGKIEKTAGGLKHTRDYEADDDSTDGEGKPVEKKKGRPKGTGGGAKFNFKKPKD